MSLTPETGCRPKWHIPAFPFINGIHDDDFLQVAIYSPLSSSGVQATKELHRYDQISDWRVFEV